MPFLGEELKLELKSEMYTPKIVADRLGVTLIQYLKRCIIKLRTLKIIHSVLYSVVLILAIDYSNH
ncbi:hypothetical protein CN923_25480 [Bacillus cereus]|nr:hypothetical protein ICG_05635 [Bacillus cereus BAG1X1-3]EOO76216.1 hypothetical protein IC7_05795 [Bacillus cereus BAG1O-1]MDR4170677.1 hypothetical protein [Bacillus nitratireducens]PEA24820.1 hypothetical protein CON44_23770 [Bacillus cereus]PEQ26287.1 hypothetical protein CN467_31610 [Bacillus cereus]